MDRARHLSARARHAAISYEGNAVSAILQHAEWRGQLVEFGHAVRARALEAHDDNDIAVELAGLERGLHGGLIRKDACGRLDRPTVAIDCAHLDAGPAEIARENAESALSREWRRRRAQ